MRRKRVYYRVRNGRPVRKINLIERLFIRLGWIKHIRRVR